MSNDFDKNKKVPNVPNLRFPEFIEKYNSKCFTDILMFLNSNSFSRDMMNYESGKYKNIHYGDILIKLPTLVDCDNILLPFVNDNILVSPKLNLLKTGDIVIADTAEDYTAGKAIEIKNKSSRVISGLHTISCRPNFEFYNGYLGYYLNSFTFRKNLLPLIQGIKVYSVSKYMYNFLFINYPSLMEQKKITNLLLNIDARIQTQNKIIEELETQKKWICQILFNAPNYPTYKVADIGILGRGRVISTSEINRASKHLYPVYSSQTSNDGIMGFLDEYMFDGEYITWTTDGANAGTVFYRNGKFNCTNVCGTIKLRDDFDAYYISYTLQLAAKKYVSTNLANPKLMNNVMAEIKIKCPDLMTQRQNAILLRRFDEKIEIEKDILTAYKKQKAYLLREMFI